MTREFITIDEVEIEITGKQQRCRTYCDFCKTEIPSGTERMLIDVEIRTWSGPNTDHERHRLDLCPNCSSLADTFGSLRSAMPV